MFHELYKIFNRFLVSPDYDNPEAVHHFRDMQSTAEELKSRINELAEERDPFEALLRTMIEARNERELSKDYENHGH